MDLPLHEQDSNVIKLIYLNGQLLAAARFMLFKSEPDRLNGFL